MTFLGLPAELVGNLGPSALVGICILAIVTGRLMPRSTVENAQAIQADRIAEARAEAEAWRTAYEKVTVSNRTLIDQAQPSVDAGALLAELLRRAGAVELPEGSPE